MLIPSPQKVRNPNLDLAGNPVADVSGHVGNVYASFDYRPATPLAAPVVTAVTAQNGAVAIANNLIPQPDTIGIHFSMPMDSYTINAGTVELFQQGVAGPLAAAVTYSPTTRTAYLTPETRLVPGAVYYVSAAATISGDQGFPNPGVPMGRAFATSFAVSGGGAAATSPLSIIGTGPRNGTPWTAPLGYGTVTFSEPINLSSLGRFSAMLVPRSGSAARGAEAYADVPVNAKVAFNPNTNQLVIVPTGVLRNDTVYLFALAGIAATNGDTLPGVEYSTFVLNDSAAASVLTRASTSAADMAVTSAGVTAPRAATALGLSPTVVLRADAAAPPTQKHRPAPPAGPRPLLAQRRLGGERASIARADVRVRIRPRQPDPRER